MPERLQGHLPWESSAAVIGAVEGEDLAPLWVRIDHRRDARSRAARITALSSPQSTACFLTLSAPDYRGAVPNPLPEVFFAFRQRRLQSLLCNTLLFPPQWLSLRGLWRCGAPVTESWTLVANPRRMRDRLRLVRDAPRGSGMGRRLACGRFTPRIGK